VGLGTWDLPKWFIIPWDLVEVCWDLVTGSNGPIERPQKRRTLPANGALPGGFDWLEKLLLLGPEMCAWSLIAENTSL
jgi:hypothetical protein